MFDFLKGDQSKENLERCRQYLIDKFSKSINGIFDEDRYVENAEISYVKSQSVDEIKDDSDTKYYILKKQNDNKQDIDTPNYIDYIKNIENTENNINIYKYLNKNIENKLPEIFEINKSSLFRFCEPIIYNINGIIEKNYKKLSEGDNIFIIGLLNYKKIFHLSCIVESSNTMYSFGITLLKPCNMDRLNNSKLYSYTSGKYKKIIEDIMKTCDLGVSTPDSYLESKIFDQLRKPNTTMFKILASSKLTNENIDKINNVFNEILESQVFQNHQTFKIVPNILNKKIQDINLNKKTYFIESLIKFVTKNINNVEHYKKINKQIKTQNEIINEKLLTYELDIKESMSNIESKRETKKNLLSKLNDKVNRTIKLKINKKIATIENDIVTLVKNIDNFKKEITNLNTDILKNNTKKDKNIIFINDNNILNNKILNNIPILNRYINNHFYYNIYYNIYITSHKYCKFSKKENTKYINCSSFLLRLFDDFMTCNSFIEQIVVEPSYCKQKKGIKTLTCDQSLKNNSSTISKKQEAKSLSNSSKKSKKIPKIQPPQIQQPQTEPQQKQGFFQRLFGRFRRTKKNQN